MSLWKRQEIQALLRAGKLIFSSVLSSIEFMTVKEVFELRMQGKIEEAYER